jgi:hypothetical protein
MSRLLHRSRLSGRVLACNLCAALGWLVIPVNEAMAHDDLPAAAAQRPPSSSPDFFLGRPSGSIGVRGSWVFARAGSDLFDFVQNQLTIDKGDFNGPAVAADVGIAITPRLEAVGGFEFSRATIGSEYRDLVDNNELPIIQQTRLQEVNLSGSVRLMLKPRGREVSRFAWVPERVAPYIGAGGGFLWYEFEQAGDFVDFIDFSVFTDVFRSSGWTPSAHVFGGADIQLHKRLYFSLEGRYLWAAGDLGTDFIDFDPIDLAGFRLAGGINILF